MMRIVFWLGFVAAALVFLTVIELSRRDILEKDTFFIGLTISIGLAFFSLIPNALRLAADLLRLEYTYVLTSTAGILGLMLLNIYTLAKLSKTTERLNELSQEVALKE